MTATPSIRQCLELLAAKDKISSSEWRHVLPTKPAPSDLMPEILDALASICAAKKGEVFAVSAEVFEDLIILRVARNSGSGVSPAVMTHLEAIWKLLQSFTPADQDEKHLALGLKIYKFSMDKLYRRVMKYGDETLKALKSLASEDTKPLWKEFDLTCEILEEINILFSEGPYPPEDVQEDLCVLIQSVLQHVESSSTPSALPSPVH